MAHSLGMIVTGGSDFHGENIPQRKLGYTAGGREIPDAFLDALESSAEAGVIPVAEGPGSLQAPGG
jgi:hypothetical protein